MTYWLYKAIALLPLSAKYAISSIASLLLREVFRYRRKVVDMNLQNAFPEKDAAWRKNIARQFYRHFTDVILEIVHASRMHREDFERHVTIGGLDALERLSENRTRPIQVLTIHLGNWEWMMLAANVICSIPVGAVYRNLHDKGANRFTQEIRERFGGEPIPMSLVAQNVLRNRKRFRALVLVADQSPGERENVYRTSFLNQQTTFFEGPATIAKLTGLPIMFAQCRRKSRGKYHMDLIPIVENPKDCSTREIIETYVKLAEQAIRAEPASFLWSNRRWKNCPTKSY